MLRLFHRLRRGRDRKEERTQSAPQALETETLVECGRVVALGIDQDREHGRIGASGALYGIDDERPTEVLTLMARGNRQPANQRRRDERVARQLLRQRRREIAERHTGRGEGVVADDLAFRPDRDEAVADAALDVLGDEFAEVAVKRFDATGERFSIMVRAEKLDPNRAGHGSFAIRAR